MPLLFGHAALVLMTRYFTGTCKFMTEHFNAKAVKLWFPYPYVLSPHSSLQPPNLLQG